MNETLKKEADSFAKYYVRYTGECQILAKVQRALEMAIEEYEAVRD